MSLNLIRQRGGLSETKSISRCDVCLWGFNPLMNNSRAWCPLCSNMKQTTLLFEKILPEEAVHAAGACLYGGFYQRFRASYLDEGRDPGISLLPTVHRLMLNDHGKLMAYAERLRQAEVDWDLIHFELTSTHPSLLRMTLKNGNAIHHLIGELPGLTSGLVYEGRRAARERRKYCGPGSDRAYYTMVAVVQYYEVQGYKFTDCLWYWDHRYA